jgi:hypothetical protein
MSSVSSEIPTGGLGFVTSPQTEVLFAALAKAQASFTTIIKDQTAEITSTRGNYQYNYASLPDVISATRGALNAQEIAVLQPVVPYRDGPAILTMLAHASGQWMQGITPFVFPDGSNPQQQGSLITYWRRYSLQAFLCVASEDDDGAAAVVAAERSAVARPNPAGYPRSAQAPQTPAGSIRKKRPLTEIIQAGVDATERAFHTQFPDAPIGSWKTLTGYQVERHLLATATGEPTNGQSNGQVRAALAELARGPQRPAILHDLQDYLAQALDAARHDQVGDSDPDIDYGPDVAAAASRNGHGEGP